MIIWFLCIFFLLLSAAGRLYGRVWKKKLSVKICFSEKACYAGGQISLEEIVTNTKKLPLPQVEVGFRVPKGLHFVDGENIVISDYVYKRDVFSLRGMEQITRRYQICCEERGRYPVSQLTFRSKEILLGKEYVWQQEEAGRPNKEDLLVYAGGTDVSGIEHFCNNLLGMEESSSSLYEDPFLFSGIRAYQPTDPMNRINWKAMARTGEMMVNTYASVQDLSCMIFLDVADMSIVKEKDLIEESIRIAASLCRKRIHYSQMAGLAVNTDPPIFLKPERGKEHLSRIEYILTDDFTLCRTIDFRMLLEMMPEIQMSAAVNIIISKNLRERDAEGITLHGVLVKPVRADADKASFVLSRCAGSAG